MKKPSRRYVKIATPVTDDITKFAKQVFGRELKRRPFVDVSEPREYEDFNDLTIEEMEKLLWQYDGLVTDLKEDQLLYEALSLDAAAAYKRRHEQEYIRLCKARITPERLREKMANQHPEVLKLEDLATRVRTRARALKARHYGVLQVSLTIRSSLKYRVMKLTGKEFDPSAKPVRFAKPVWREYDKNNDYGVMVEEEIDDE